MRRFASSSFALVLGLGLIACNGGSGGNNGDDGGGHGSGSGSDDPDGGHGSDGPDAPVGEQSCGAAIATTASPDFTISGVINDNDDGFGTTATSQLEGATVTAFHNGSATALGSDESGPWGIEVTSSKTVDYVTMALDGYQSNRFYPKAPAGTTVTFLSVPMLVNDGGADDTFNELASSYGVVQDPGKGIIAEYVFDCQGDRITGATVTSSAGGTAKYVGNGASTNGTGVALIFNVPAGNTILNASGGGAPAFHQVSVAASPDYITIAVIAPKSFD